MPDSAFVFAPTFTTTNYRVFELDEATLQEVLRNDGRHAACLLAHLCFPALLLNDCLCCLCIACA